MPAPSGSQWRDLSEVCLGRSVSMSRSSMSSTTLYAGSLPQSYSRQLAPRRARVMIRRRRPRWPLAVVLLLWLPPSGDTTSSAGGPDWRSYLAPRPTAAALLPAEGPGVVQILIPEELPAAAISRGVAETPIPSEVAAVPISGELAAAAISRQVATAATSEDLDAAAISEGPSAVAVPLEAQPREESPSASPGFTAPEQALFSGESSASGTAGAPSAPRRDGLAVSSR